MDEKEGLQLAGSLLGGSLILLKRYSGEDSNGNYFSAKFDLEGGDIGNESFEEHESKGGER